MTALSDFVGEIAAEMDARIRQSSPIPLPSDADWIALVKVLAWIDRDEEPAIIELRKKIEWIVSQGNARFQDRCRAVIPLLRLFHPNGWRLQ